MTLRQPAIRSFLLLVSLSPLLLVCPSCTEDALNLQSAHDQAAATLQEAQSDRDRIRRELTALPPDDPVRKALAPQLDRLDQLIAKTQAYLPLLEAAAQSMQSQPIDPALAQALAAVPYGSLALALLGITVGAAKHLQSARLLAQHQQSQKAFDQIVQALAAPFPAATPTPPAPDQQAQLTAALTPEVKAQLAAAKA